MSDFVGRLSWLDTVAGMPVWMAGALAAVAAFVCLLALNRSSIEGLFGDPVRIALILIGVVLSWVFLNGMWHRDLAFERHALDTRAADLVLRATTPGSALACLGAAAGETVEAACEKAVFATPEATAAAVAFVSTQIALLADATDLARHDPNYRGLVAQLRHSAEVDRYGIVAHVLTAREGCKPDRCASFALLKDSSRVSSNMAERSYEALVAHYAADWHGAADAPVARSSPGSAVASVPAAPPPVVTRVPGPDVFFPSADSIPAVNIMNAEPPVSSPETTGATPPSRAAPPQRKGTAASTHRPVDLSAERAAPPASAPR